jgi:hypothetical protein
MGTPECEVRSHRLDQFVVAVLLAHALGTCGGKVTGDAAASGPRAIGGAFAASALSGAGSGPTGGSAAGGATSGGVTAGGTINGGTNSGGISTGGTPPGGGAPASGAANVGSGGRCAVDPQGAPPFTVTLRFQNPGPGTAWLSPHCFGEVAGFSLRFAIESCTDGYATELGLFAGCVDCAVNPCDRLGGCGPCPPRAPVAVPPGSHVDVDWKGIRFVPEVPDAGCYCLRAQEAPAGVYRVSVPVWTDPPYDWDAGKWTSTVPLPDFVASTDFILDRAGSMAVVELVR